LKTKILLLFALLVFKYATAKGQDSAIVYGVVLNKASGKPIEGAQIIYAGSEKAITTTSGIFRIQVEVASLDSIGVYTFSSGIVYFKIRNIKKGETRKVKLYYKIKDNVVGVTRIKNKEFHEHDGAIKINTAPLTTLPNSSGGIEALIKSQIGVTSGNELSSQYNVRGGNFDENLIYVNGFQIYKPQLVHSGQQEGLSLPHPDLVKNLTFYAGGFAARYGDKLSSVLDVEYKRPDSFALTFSGGLLGGSVAMENKKARFTALTGIRYKTAKFLLNTLDVQGQYSPRFIDAQLLLNYELNDNWTASFLGHIAENRYLTKPESRETSFGTVQSALRIFVALDGAELLQYNTYMGGLAMLYDNDHDLKLRFASSSFYSLEREYNDVLGAYRLDVLDNNLGSESFGTAVGSLGNGFFINHARNDLDVIISNFEHTGVYKKKRASTSLEWGAKVQFEDIKDKFKEWDYSDSSGYNIPPGGIYRDDSIFLSSYINSNINLVSQRYSGFLQAKTRLFDTSRAFLTYGVRFQHWSVNQDLNISPRAQFSFEPNRKYNLGAVDSLKKKDMSVRFALGYYYQAPFYRELRRESGTINRNLKAQKAIHYVLGTDWLFKAWGRDFKFLSEVYYKQLDNIVPYYYDNIRVRYLAENSGKGFATGWDTRINGEFIKGLESWVTVSLMKTSEQLDYIDDSGEAANSGLIRRPTDRRVNVAIMFQDELLNDKSFRMNLNLLFGTSLPYYLGGYERYREGNSIPSYRRVDIGFTKVLKDASHGLDSKSKIGNNIKSAFLSLEVFNLLDINNVVSYLWVKDVSNNVYGVPNFLTSRTLNLKFTVRL